MGRVHKKSTPKGAFFSARADVPNLHHTHAAALARTSERRQVGTFLGDFVDGCLGDEDQASNGCCRLQSGARNLYGIGNAHLNHAALFAVCEVVAFALSECLGLFDNNGAFIASVGRDSAHRSLERLADDVNANLLVCVCNLNCVKCADCVDESYAATSNDTFFNCCAGCLQSVFDAALLFLKLRLGSSANLKNSNATGKLGQALLQLFLVEVGGEVLQLVAHLSNTSVDCSLVACTVNDNGCILGNLNGEIVADAGIHGAVTIATNMAGRGTDIKLDEISRELGGLKIIGTERHESRRIDNQLRGRAGRQGDPGESRFYLSLEDDLMRLFGSERLMNMFNAMGVPENEQIEHKMLSKAIEKAQMKIETNNYGIRENLLKYDEVMNEQREAIYAERRRVLDGENMRSVIMKMITDIVENAVDMSISDEQEPAEWDLSELNSLLLPVIPLEPIQLTEDQQHMKKNELKHMLKEAATKLYETREAEFTSAEQVREMERVILLKVVDAKWMAHIDDMDQLREGIGLQAYGQRDPLVEYKMSGYEMFDSMTAAIREDTVRILFHIRAEQKVEREPAAKVTGTNRDDSTVQAPKKREEKKIYPNDPCPCGSGKKYKQCCGRKLYAKN